ncbi:MAG: hypothetical protein AB7P03_27605 [Kofleriaceae bacterium]
MIGSRLAEIARRIVAAAKFVKSLPRRAWHWLVSNATRCIAIGWIAGMVAFAGVTVVRVRQRIADDNARASQFHLNAPRIVKDSDGPGETVAMLDVDEINNIRNERMHANGLAAAGEDEPPDQAAIDAARKSRATAKEVEGDVAGTSGKITVVTKGGIAGWIKRNKGKKADPETLAWLRGEEAAEGRSAYAGWADREDGNILNWAKANKATAGSGANDADQGAALAEAGVALPARASRVAAPASPVAAAGPVGSVGSADLASAKPLGPATGPAGASPAESDGPSAGSTPSSTPTSTPTSTASSTPGSTPSSTASATGTPAGVAPPVTAPPRRHAAAGPRARVAMGFDVVSLGRAAVAAITGDAAPTAVRPEEIEQLRAQLRDVADPGTIVTIVRDHRAVLLLRADLLYGRGTTELSFAGKMVVRRLSKLLSALPDRAYQIHADPDRGMELAGTLVVSGLDAERLAMADKAIDPAIDLLEIEMIFVRAHRPEDAGVGAP